MLMILAIIFLAVLGAVMGSFIDAITWRLHTKRNFVSDRSECEHCHHKLGPLDLIPVVSWIMLGGKCRYCRAPISRIIPFTEVGMALLFVGSYVYWPLGLETWQGMTLLVLWLIYLVILGILFVYDLRWQLLPDVLTYPLIIIGLVDGGIRVWLQNPGATIADYATYVVLGVAAMAGVYALLYMVSRGKWVGFGDVKLAIFIGAVLGWEKTLTVLMLANVIGLVAVAPGLFSKKLTPKSHVPFGPFMIVAFVLVGLFGDALINWYMHTFVLL